MNVVITGMGAVTPYGIGFKAIVDGIFSEHSPLRAITVCDTTGSQLRVAGECRQLEEAALPNRKLKKMISRKDHLALAAAHDAWIHAGLVDNKVDPARKGVFVGACSTQFGDFFPYFEQVLDCVSADKESFNTAKLGQSVIKDVNPIVALKVLTNGALAHLSQTYDLQGPSTNVMNFGTSGLEAVQLAYGSIKAGHADLCLAGGVYAPFDPFQLADGIASRDFATSDHDPHTLIRPYHEMRQGTLPCEAAAFVVLESEDHARRRKAEIFGRILATSRASSAEWDGRGALQSALKQYSIAPAYVIGCGHGHLLIDQWELETFADATLTSVFGRLGYPAEASGVIQLIAAIGCLQNGMLAPTFNGLLSEPISLMPQQDILISSLNRFGSAATAVIASA